MKKNIKNYFHPEYMDELEDQLKILGQREINWIITDINEANENGNDFKITKMQFNSKHKTINLQLKDESSDESINRDLIL